MTPEVQVWRGAVLVLPDGSAIFRPEVVVLVAGLFTAYARAEGVPLSPLAAHVRNSCLVAASQASIGPSDVRSRLDSPSSEAWVGTAQIASRLGVVQRHAHRLLRSGAFGEARKMRGRWWIREEELEAYIVMKEQTA